MNADIWRPRLVTSISLAYRQCWGEQSGALDAAGAGDPWIDGFDETQLRLIAMADLVLPFAAAGLLPEASPVADLPAPAELRRAVLEAGFQGPSVSIGCALASAQPEPSSLLNEEMSREWATWIGYCMEAHSYELRAALIQLPLTVDAISVFQSRPRKRLVRTGPDGERLISVVPSGPTEGADDAWIEPFLDGCEAIAAVSDSFRRIDLIFPEVLRLVAKYQGYSRADFVYTLPFHPQLWPFAADSYFKVSEIAQVIGSLARRATFDDESDEMGRGESAYSQV